MIRLLSSKLCAKETHIHFICCFFYLTLFLIIPPSSGMLLISFPHSPTASHRWSYIGIEKQINPLSSLLLLSIVSCQGSLRVPRPF